MPDPTLSPEQMLEARRLTEGPFAEADVARALAARDARIAELEALVLKLQSHMDEGAQP